MYPLKAPKQIYVSWSFPHAGWTKDNVDRAFCGTSGPTGAVGVFQTYRRFVRGAFTFPLQSHYPFETELMVAIYGI